jgi:hypothetical protein
MNSYIILWIALLLLVAISANEAFRTYFFVPRWENKCGKWSGPPSRYPRSEPPWWYVPYLEPFTSMVIKEEVDTPAALQGPDQLSTPSDNAKRRTTASGYNFPIVPAELLKEPFLTTDQIADEVALASSQGRVNEDKVANPILSYVPNGPAPITNVQEPYVLLGDEFKAEALPPGTIGTVGSKACYETDFGRVIEKTGSFRQTTNNYKHGYPDSCSAPFHELILDIYQDDGMLIKEPPKMACGAGLREVPYTQF